MLGFYHCDAILPEVILINAGLLAWLDWFSQCGGEKTGGEKTGGQKTGTIENSIWGKRLG